ncbi:hypothetical protein INR49_002476 [Caranx melampygus]|nr:hypothetical protein INR49_002476 [Caranx melampygus]
MKHFDQTQDAAAAAAGFSHSYCKSLGSSEGQCLERTFPEKPQLRSESQGVTSATEMMILNPDLKLSDKGLVPPVLFSCAPKPTVVVVGSNGSDRSRPQISPKSQPQSAPERQISSAGDELVDASVVN